MLAAPTDVQAFLSLPTTQDTALLELLCEAASSFVLTYCNRDTFAITARTERYNGTGSRVLVVDNRPIVSVQSVSIYGKDVPASVDFGNGYIFDKTSITLYGSRFDKDIRNVEVSYTSGFATLPASIKQAVVEIVAEKYQRRTRLGVSSKSIGQETISYSQNDLGPSAKAVLNQYKIPFLTT